LTELQAILGTSVYARAPTPAAPVSPEAAQPAPAAVRTTVDPTFHAWSPTDPPARNVDTPFALRSVAPAARQAAVATPPEPAIHTPLAARPAIFHRLSLSPEQGCGTFRLGYCLSRSGCHLDPSY
jgi:hypothetical protein